MISPRARAHQTDRLFSTFKSQLKSGLRLKSKVRKHADRPAVERISVKEILAVFAVERLRTRCSSNIRRILAPSAWRRLQQALLARFSAPLTPTIRVVQQAVEAAATFDPHHCRIQNVDPRTILLDLFEHFPGAAETAAQITLDWIDAELEMLRRLSRNIKQLWVIAPKIRSNDRVVSFDLDLSDLHDSGRSVAAIRFESGNRIIYKPRTSDGERAWFGALRWMNQNGFPARFKIPKILWRSRFFWMQFLSQKDCQSIEAIKRFYFRWGAQAALAQVLQFEDLHRDNWIAAGEHPVLLDTEMIRQPRRDSSGFSVHWARLAPLLRTGLLPIHKRERVGFYAGIAPFDSLTSTCEKLDFWPQLAKRHCPPQEFAGDLINGYRAAIGFITSSEQSLRSFARIAALKDRAMHRILHRATAQYYKLLHDSYVPKHMIERGARLTHLKQACMNSHVSRHVATQEAEALFRCSIPRFTTRAANRARKVAINSNKIWDSSDILQARVTPAARSEPSFRRPHRQL